MRWYNKVVWSEGLFLHPQLFQQQERYLEHMAHARSLPLSPFFWGCSALEIASDSLSLGKVALRRAVGVFQDGTPFDAPGHTPLPDPFAVTETHLGQVVYLTLPARSPGDEEITFEETPGSLARFGTFEAELPDVNSMGMEPQTVQLARLRLRLVPESELSGALMGLAVARVLEVRSDGGVRLDPDFLPTVSNCAASEKLLAWLTEIHGLVHLRAEGLAAALVGADADNTVAEVSDYLLLQTFNRYEPLLEHLLRVRRTSPEALYRLFATLAGELSTFLRFRTRRPSPYPEYRHDQPGAALQSVVEDLRLLLNIVLERGAQRIPLEPQPHGRSLAVFAPGEADGFSSLVLSVAAHLPRDVLSTEFPVKTKIGPPDRLAQLVRSHVPGVFLQPLAVAPRQIPFNVAAVYFELRREGMLWDLIREGGGLAIHVAGDFPGLHMELWGTRDR